MQPLSRNSACNRDARAVLPQLWGGRVWPTCGWVAVAASYCPGQPPCLPAWNRLPRTECSSEHPISGRTLTLVERGFALFSCALSISPNLKRMHALFAFNEMQCIEYMSALLLYLSNSWLSKSVWKPCPLCGVLCRAVYCELIAHVQIKLDSICQQ